MVSQRRDMLSCGVYDKSQCFRSELSQNNRCSLGETEVVRCP